MQEKRFQNRIKLFTFALTILVIWVHSVNLTPEVLLSAGFGIAGDGAALTAGASGVPAFLSAFSPAFYQAALSIEHFLTDTLGQIAVPGFFMVSAYLFFRNADRTAQGKLRPAWVLGKWKRRFFSLLLPFVLWNLIYYGIHLLAGGAAAVLGFSSAEIVSLDAGTILSAAIFYTYNPVFWYLYQLILLTILAPALYFFVRGRRTGLCALALSLCAAVFWDRLPFHIVNEDALFYYLLGIYAALHKSVLVERGASGRRSRDSRGRYTHKNELMEQETSAETADSLRRTFCFLLGLFVLWCILFPGGFLPQALYGTAELAVLRSVLFRTLLPFLFYFGLMLASEIREARAEREAEKSFRKANAAAWQAAHGDGAGRKAARQDEEQGRETLQLAGSESRALPGFMEINYFIYATHYLVIKAGNALAFAALRGAAATADGTALTGSSMLADSFTLTNSAALLNGAAQANSTALTNGAVLCLLLYYLLLPVICTAAAYAASLFLKRFLPAFWWLLSGGR